MKVYLPKYHILSGFDMDETLVHTDPSVDKSHNFMEFKVINELPTYELFKAIIVYGKDFPYIITTRHPDVAEQILSHPLFSKFAGKFELICRDFCLEKSEMALVNTSKERLEKFLTDMVDFKVRTLIHLAYQSSHLVNYYDDMAQRLLAYENWQNFVHRMIFIHYPIGFEGFNHAN